MVLEETSQETSYKTSRLAQLKRYLKIKIGLTVSEPKVKPEVTMTHQGQSNEEKRKAAQKTISVLLYTAHIFEGQLQIAPDGGSLHFYVFDRKSLISLWGVPGRLC